MNHNDSCLCNHCVCPPGNPWVSLQVWRIRFETVTGILKREQFESFRVATNTQDEAERIAAALLTTWLRANPGKVGSYTITGLSSQELGGE